MAGDHAQSLEQRFLLTITPISAATMVPEGNPGPVVVGTFTDTTPSLANDYTAQIKWDDGTTSTGTVTAGDTGYTVTGIHGYPDENNGVAVTVSVAESEGADKDTATIVSTITATESDTLTGTLADFSPTEGTAFTGPVAIFTDAGNPVAVNTDFTATIDWGDGTTSTGVVPSGTNPTFTVTGNHTYPEGTDGPTTVTVVLSDDAPGTATGTATGTIDVQESPFTLTAVPVTGGEGTTLTATVATFTDPGTTMPTGYTASIDWGDGTTSAGTVAGASGNFSVSGMHDYVDEGSYTITATVTDLDPNFTTKPVTTVATISDTDMLAPISGIFAPFTEGTAGTLLGFFSDANMTNTADDFTASIAWGDGTSSAAAVTGGNGVFTVTGLHAYTEEQNAFATATISDDAPGVASASISGIVSVSDADILTPRGTIGAPSPEGSSTTFNAVFADTYQTNDASDFTGTIIWGDGATTAGTVTGGTAFYTVSGTHIFTDEGPYTVAATLADDAPGTATATVTSTLVIPDADVVTGTLAPISAVVTQPFSGTVATFTNTGTPPSPASDYTAAIDWGDGTTSTGTVAGTNTSYTVTGGHTYANGADGTQNVVVTLTDDGPGTTPVTASGTVVVIPILSGTVSFSPTEASPYNGPVATFTNNGRPVSGGGTYSASIDWGDGTTTSGTVSGAGTLTVSGSHTYAQGNEGPENVTVTISQDTPGAPTGTATGTIVVREQASSFITKGAGISGPETLIVSGTIATFTDAGSTDPASEFRAVINWGDNTALSTGTITGSNGAYTISSDHVYAEEGKYTIHTTIFDDSANFASAPVSSTATITEADVLVTNTHPAASVQVGDGATTIINDTFADTGYPGANPAHFTATIKWGDGKTTTGTVTGGIGANLTVTAAHAYASAGKYTATVTLADNAPGTATVTTTNAITVNSVPIAAHGGFTVKGVEGNTFSATTFASFTDPNPGSHTATILWGDGTSSAGTIVSAGGGTFLVKGSHKYVEQGQYPVTVKISRNKAVVSTVQSTANIADAPLAVTGLTINVKHGVAFNGTVATMIDGDPLNTTPGDYKGTINWGDGTSSSATFVRVSAGHWQIKGKHTFTRIGKFTVKISVQDSQSPLFSGSGMAKVI